MPLHLIKIAVGVKAVEDLARLQKRWHVKDDAGRTVHRVRTRQTPKRQAELLDGGSMYWIVKGFIAARQEILNFEPTVMDGQKYMLIHVDPQVIPVVPTPRGPHQGWRYFKDTDSPPDLTTLNAKAKQLPIKLQQDLRALALL